MYGMSWNMLRSTPVRENNMFSIWGSKCTVVQQENLSEMFLLIDESEDFNLTNSAKHVDFFTWPNTNYT